MHLEKIVGTGMPIAYALDGYPVYGSTEPDGSPMEPLDALGGHEDGEGGYHDHALKQYPYLIGGFRGEVVDRDGQVDPRPRAQGVRDALPALRGATIVAFESPVPNFVVILMDDLGWRDLGCMGNTFVETPHIDRLAKAGVVFTRAYASAPNCAPTRACLMSGQWTRRHGIYTVVDPRQPPTSAVREGDYKLIEFFEDGGRVELYNLREDPGEQRDLTRTMPEKARALSASLRAWQQETKAMLPTTANPDYDPRAARGPRRGR